MTRDPSSSLHVTVRSYVSSDEVGWVRCRALSLLSTQYYDDVKPRRTPLREPSIALVATDAANGLVGLLDVEIDRDSATIDTVAVHPDHQNCGVATALLDRCLPLLKAHGVTSLDAWTREDAAANRWYRRNGFVENVRYVHVHLGEDDDRTGFESPEGLSAPVTAFLHGRIEDERLLRSRYHRVYVCRQYVRALLHPGAA
ncbi:MAG: GNAT family N-acetyltransferase [Micrococcales bacterium]|nr:GNAT family N-acetyltransferase [Micrococcales bacterium]